MSDETTSDTGATDDTPTGGDSPASTEGTEPVPDERIEQLEAENDRLREQVDDLEATLAVINDELADAQNRTADDMEPGEAGDGATPESGDGATPELVTSGGQPTKIIGKIPDDDGIGVLGEATGDGATAGVQGEAGSIDGYGLYTPDDAKVDGEIETTELNSNGNDFTLQTGYTADETPGNIVMGHQDNAAWANGATIAGGGSSGSDDMNIASGEFPTISGGRGNQILTTEENYNTITGGRNNVMGADGDFDPLYSTISGGRDNEIKDANYAFVAGRNAVAKHDGAVVFGDSTDAEITSARADEARFQGDLATNSELRTNANASDSLSYLRFRDETGSDGPRLFHSETSDHIAVRGEEEFDVDMDLQVNRDGTHQRAGGPVAKASIASDASIHGAVNVESVMYVHDGSYYSVELTGIDYTDDEYMAVVIPRSVFFPRVSVSSTDGDNLKVEFSDEDQNPFHLVVYEAPSGTQTTDSSESTADDEAGDRD